MMPWLGAVLTFLFLPFCLFAVLSRAVGASSRETPALAAACLGLGPLVASWLLTGLLAIAPGRTDGFYLTVVTTVFVLAGLWGVGRRPVLPAYVPPTGPARLCLAVLLAMSVLLVAQAVLLPLNGNDPLEYALVAKVLYADKSLAHYPLRQADPATGLYAGSSHPLGYLSLLVWTALFDGGGFGWLSKAVSPFFSLATLTLFLANRRQDRLLHGSLAGLLFLGAPLYFQTSAICHIDSLRLYALYLSVFCMDRIPLAPNRRGRTWIFLCGVAAGFSLFSHSIGLLTLPFLGVCFLTRMRRSLLNRLSVLTVISVLALTIGGGRYLQNMVEYGVPLRDDEPVWSLPIVDYTGYNDRLKTISTPVDRLVNGILTPFVRFNGPTDNAVLFFGLSFWLAGLSVVWRRRDTLSDAMARDCLLCLGVFFVLCSGSVLAGSSLIIKNVRYFLTVLPFAAYLGAIPAAALVSRASRGGRLERALATVGGLIALCGGTLAMQAVTACFVLPNLGILGQGELAYLRRTYGGEYFYPAGYEAVAFVREQTPPNSRVLVFRKNEMAAYGGRRILADTDPALLPFYAATDPDTAMDRLRALGVTHIFVPNYQPPTFTNTQASVVADDPRRSELVFSQKGYRIYRLLADPLPGSSAPAAPLPEVAAWTRPAPFVPSFVSELSAPLAAFSGRPSACGRTDVEDVIAVTPSGVYSGPGPLELPPSASFAPAPITAGAAYRFVATVSGQGWLKVFLLFYRDDGGLTWDVVFDGVARGETTELCRQVLVPAGIWQYRMLFVSGPRDTLAVSRPRLLPLGSPQPVAAEAPSAAGLEPVSAIPGEAPWLATAGPAIHHDILDRAWRVRQTDLVDAALFRADGVTLPALLIQALSRGYSQNPGDQGMADWRLLVAASGRGRVECFVAWDGGVAYAGVVAPSGGDAVAELSVRLPAGLSGARALFRSSPDGEGPTVTAAGIVPSRSALAASGHSQGKDGSHE